MALPEIIKDIEARIIRPTSTDNAIVRFDGTTGQVQNSTPLIDDNGTITFATKAYQTNNIAGYYADQYGNFFHSRASTADHWQIHSYDQSKSLKYYPDIGNLSIPNEITAAKFTVNNSGEVYHPNNPPLNIVGWKTQEITVGGDLDTYYPVVIDSSFSDNTRLLTIYVSKTLGTTSPAWSGNHTSGSSSLMSGWQVRNNGWDGNGSILLPIFKPQCDYAPLIARTELRESSAHYLVVWLRGGGATYKVTTDYNCGSIGVYLSETNIGSSTYPNNVSPLTTRDDNPGLNYKRPVYLPITGGTVSGDITANKVYGAVWNDYAEYRTYKDSDKIPYGRVVIENGDDSLSLSTERLQLGGNICSDTFGFAIGETDNAKLPIAVSGRVLAYTNEPRDTYKPGEALCSGPNGTVSKMTREEIKEYPDAIIGYVSAVPDYETWGTGNVKVDGRIWVKIK